MTAIDRSITAGVLDERRVVRRGRAYAANAGFYLGLLGAFGVDPRKQLAGLMRQHFDEQAKYRSAALRGGSRAHSRPRIHIVPRVASGPLVSADSAPRSEPTLALVPPVVDEDNSVTRRHLGSDSRPRSGSVPALANDDGPASASRTLTAGPGRHWGWWLGLPMLGAGLAVAILLAVFTWRDENGGNQIGRAHV